MSIMLFLFISVPLEMLLCTLVRGALQPFTSSPRLVTCKAASCNDSLLPHRPDQTLTKGKGESPPIRFVWSLLQYESACY